MNRPVLAKSGDPYRDGPEPVEEALHDHERRLVEHERLLLTLELRLGSLHDPSAVTREQIRQLRIQIMMWQTLTAFVLLGFILIWQS